MEEDDSFKDRVDKVFGSLSSSSSSTTPWSLSGAEVERREWNRDKGHHRDDDQTPVSSSFNNFFNKCHQTQEDTEEEAGDEWEIRSFIGLDATLDNEEEEDAYDKMAEGREDAGCYDHGPYLNSHNILPCSLHDVKKDPRANHDAAKTRLIEDDDVVSENADEVMLNAEEARVTVPASEDGTRVKSILKRKNLDVVKPAKRVRFDSTCKNDDDALTNGIPQKASGGVPDYILNPSKYTQYSMDEFSHDANTQAYLDFLEQVKNSKDDSNSSGDMPRSVVFIPKKKRADGGEAACNSDKQSSTEAQAEAGCGVGVGIAAVAVQQGEISQEMQEEADDAECTIKDRSQKPGRRQYRTKMGADDDI
ncbi:hypothetical protein OSB04_009085 [Centaurea solstitialis]|uniref:Protein TSSC4 n=1 Tax=Centaurea solstitialis TaxID=347529 RepID=A0AA38TMZ7_9ASTR|nr:hypothetical protein OSB04_009085 [Centaurea solstitialis]